MKICLSDNGQFLRFAPLTLTRPIADLRTGIFTNTERWQRLVPQAQIFYKTESYLQEKFADIDYADITVNACVIPGVELVKEILDLPNNASLYWNNNWIATKGEKGTEIRHYHFEILMLSERWHMFSKNDLILKRDFELATKGRVSEPLSATNTVIGDPKHIFLEKGARVEAAVINVLDGPLYVGEHAEIMEGAMIRGGLALGAHAALKLGAKVYGASTLGPHCKVGGEINNVLFQGYSNKGHDGFLGNALIGEWCNLGADTNASNLMNTYGEVSTYSYEKKELIKTDMQFMGLVMGDHSKCGINTMFNTATVVGVSTNIFGAGFPDKYIPSFRWGGSEGFAHYRLDKAMENINNMMNRRGLKLSGAEIAILKKIAAEF